MELVKASIDPDKIVANVLLDGRPLEAGEWKQTIASLGEAHLQFTTGEKDSFLLERIQQAPEILERIVGKFKESRVCYNDGSSVQGSDILHKSVENLSAFFSWYTSILVLEDKIDEEYMNGVIGSIQSICETCEAINQLLVYNSFWAIGDTLEAQLVPKLESFISLTDRFRIASERAGKISGVAL